MSPIQQIEDLTLDFNKLSSIELQGEPMQKKACSVQLYFQDEKPLSAHSLKFKDYGDAYKTYERISSRWMHFEEERARRSLLKAAEKELAF